MKPPKLIGFVMAAVYHESMEYSTDFEILLLSTQASPEEADVWHEFHARLTGRVAWHWLRHGVAP